MLTAQISLAANAARLDALNMAKKRIETVMLSGARALAGTRTATSEYWISEERDLSSSAPHTGRTVLIWRDHGDGNQTAVRPYDDERTTYSVQIIVPDSVTPLQLREVARMAELFTDEICERCALTIAAQVAESTALRDGFNDILA